ncbi:MAG TPA: VCBS repeat-containing protein [Candidatus Hydrogenedentes bacterium]|nr:VCBS repeat-containing protein [Candidatus Hydrogenedentota bacterium]HOL77576.1 VCBS repeat-containing protein [Candidatus Hydrogenedentota bacterium]HPO84881.1 VCBS repeat-containing protein [Candidatus Hydrogenedentota bacterium]
MSVLALFFYLGAFFDLSSIPLQNEEAVSFLAPISSHSPIALFVVDNDSLIIQTLRPLANHRIILERGTAAIDVCDLDGDGNSEVVAVCGERIMRYTIPSDETSIPPETLFVASSMWSVSCFQAKPVPLVICVRGEKFVGLPTENAYQLYRFDGTCAFSFPKKEAVHQESPFGQAFSLDFRGSSTPNSIAMRVYHSRGPSYDLPDSLVHGDDIPALYKKISFSQHTLLEDVDYKKWPWFRLHTKQSPSGRVFYRLIGPGFRETEVVVDDAEALQKPDKPLYQERWSAFKYPGRLFPAGEMVPDFNGDGYADILLFSSPDPLTSTDFWGRFLVDGCWPLRVSVHLFLPEKKRFSPIPASVISLKLPLARFLMYQSEGYLKHVLFRDFDGDGHTDCGWAIKDNEYQIWLWKTDGFSEKPEYVAKFADDIIRIEHCADMTGDGFLSIVFRTNSILYILRVSQ